MDVEQKVNDLKNSLMFQLSLSSKELFHSNFIYWLISTYSVECSRLFSEFLSNKDKQEIIKITREDKNRDIVIYFESETGLLSSLVIENKIKSLPRYEQLRDYTTLNKTEHYLLLSLAKPNFLAENNKIVINEFDREWDYINYCKLSEMLEEIVSEIETKNSYHSLIIRDYIKFVKTLNDVTEEAYNTVINGRYDFYQKQNNKFSLLKTIRMHDFYLKLNHEILATELHSRIRREIGDLNLVKGKKWSKAKNQEVFTDFGFTRGSGITEVKYVIGHKFDIPIIVGIQIQDVQFRLFIESKKEYAGKIARKLLDNNMWFDFSYLTDSFLLDGKQYPDKPNKQFNSYSGEFYYRSVKLKNCNSRELIDLMLNYLKYIHEEKENLMRKINEVI
ncbi:hypothetical protein ASG66_17015 [Bacillus sp. Leaf406]|nr:hypothetical protein ASG66_17015 [Bacillus sp. Leaf406]